MEFRRTCYLIRYKPETFVHRGIRDDVITCRLRGCSDRELQFGSLSLFITDRCFSGARSNLVLDVSCHTDTRVS